MSTPYSHGVVYTLKRDECISATDATEKSFRMESLRAFQVKTDTDFAQECLPLPGPWLSLPLGPCLRIQEAWLLFGGTLKILNAASERIGSSGQWNKKLMHFFFSKKGCFLNSTESGSGSGCPSLGVTFSARLLGLNHLTFFMTRITTWNYLIPLSVH